MDDNLAFRRVNAKLEMFWNMPRHKLIGKTFLELFPAAREMPFYKIINESRKNKAANTQDVLCPITAHWVHLSLSPYSDGIVVIFYDIQNEKEAEQELIKQHTILKKAEEEIKLLNTNLAIKNRQLQSANAEIKTFNIIAATDYTETLRHLYTNFEYIIINDGNNLSHAGRANIRRAQAAIQKMKLLTDDLNAYTRLKEIEGERRNINLSDIIKTVTYDFAGQLEQSGAEIEISCTSHVEAYPFLVSLVFHHLIDNAIKFRKEDGSKHTIQISCSDSVSGGETNDLSLQNEFKYVVVTISDNGIGFPKEEAEKIFSIFYRLHDKQHYKGSGIGLAICKKIMDLHGGLITAQGYPGKGATFQCFFPVLSFDPDN